MTEVSSSIVGSSSSQPSVSAPPPPLSPVVSVPQGGTEATSHSLAVTSVCSGSRLSCASPSTSANSEVNTGQTQSLSCASSSGCPSKGIASNTISLARLVPTSALAGLPIDFSKHVVRLPISSTALLDSALSRTNYEMSGVDTLATVAAALDPRQSSVLPPPPPNTGTGGLNTTGSMDSVDSAMNSLPVLAKSADGFVMKLVDSRSLKLVNPGGSLYVNVPKDKLMKTQLSGEYQVVRPVVNQSIKQLYAQTRSPAPRSPAPGGLGAPEGVGRSATSAALASTQSTSPSHAKSPRPTEEPVLSFQVLKAGDKHARRPVSESPRYITQLTQNIQQQQQQQQQLSTSLEAAYVMRSLPSQTVQTVRISDHQRVTTVLPSGYTAQAVLPPGRNKVEYHVLTPEQLQKMERVKSEYPTSHTGKSEYIVRTVAGVHMTPGQVDSKTSIRSLDVQTMKVVDTLARSVQPSGPSRHTDYTTTTMVNSHGTDSQHHVHRSHALETAQAAHRSLSADVHRKPGDKPGYNRVLSVDTALAAHSAPSSDSSSGYSKRYPPRVANDQSLPVDEKMIDPELKNLLNDSDKTHWGVVIFNGWLTTREFRVSPAQLDSVNLASLLTMFYSDLKSELSPEHLNLASLLDMRDAIDQYFRSRGHPCSIVTDIRFGLANQAFDSVIAACDAENKLVGLGIARQSQLADSKQDSGSRGNPRDLLTRVWVDIKSHLRGFNVDQLRQMKKTDFLVSACDDGRLIVNHVVRNWQDIIKAPLKTGTEFKCIPFMYQNKENPAICPVQTFMEYSSRLCPSGVEFFQHPLTNYKYAGRIWYSCEKGTRCYIHHRDDTRTPPSSGRSTPSASTPKQRRRSSTGKAVHPSPSPVQSPRPTSTYSDSVHSDQGGDRQRAQEDGSFSPLPDISSILKQPPPLAQIHDNIYHTPVSTPASIDTPTPTPMSSTKPKKKKKSSKKSKEIEKQPVAEPTTSTSDATSEGQVSHLDDILAEVVDKNRRDDVDADRMCMEAMNGDQSKPRSHNSLQDAEGMDGSSLPTTHQQMAELALRSLEAAVAPSSGVSDAEADRMIGHVVAGLEQADRHQQAGLDMIIDYVVSSNVGEYNELYQYLADDQQPKAAYSKQRRPRNHDLTSNGSSEVMSDIDSVIDQVIQAPGYDELAAPLVSEAEWSNLAEKRKTPDPEQTLPPKKRKKANNMKMNEFAAPSVPMQYIGEGSPNARSSATPRTQGTPVERKYTSMDKIDVLIDEVIAKSLDWTEDMDYDDDTLETEAMEALQDSLPDLASLGQGKLMSGAAFMPGPSTSAFQAYSQFPSTSYSPSHRLPPVNTVMRQSPVPTSYSGTSSYGSGQNTPTHYGPPPRYPGITGPASAPTTPTGAVPSMPSGTLVGQMPLGPLGPSQGPLGTPQPLPSSVPLPPPPYPSLVRKAGNNSIPLSDAVQERHRDKVTNSLTSSHHSSHPSLSSPSHITSTGLPVHTLTSTFSPTSSAIRARGAVTLTVNSSAATTIPSAIMDTVSAASLGQMMPVVNNDSVAQRGSRILAMGGRASQHASQEAVNELQARASLAQISHTAVNTQATFSASSTNSRTLQPSDISADQSAVTPASTSQSTISHSSTAILNSASLPSTNHNLETTSISLRSSVTPERKLSLRSADRKTPSDLASKLGFSDYEDTSKPPGKRVTPDRKAREGTPKNLDYSKRGPVDQATEKFGGKSEKQRSSDKNIVIDKNAIADKSVDSPANETRRGTRFSTRGETDRRVRQHSESSTSEERRSSRASVSTPSREVSPDATDRVTRSYRKSATTLNPKAANDNTYSANSSTATTRTRRSTTGSTSSNGNNNNNNNNNSNSSGVGGGTNGPKNTKTSTTTPTSQPQNSTMSMLDATKKSEATRTTRSSGKLDEKSMQLREKSQRFRQLMQRILSDDSSGNNSASSSS